MKSRLIKFVKRNYKNCEELKNNGQSIRIKETVIHRNITLILILITISRPSVFYIFSNRNIDKYMRYIIMINGQIYNILKIQRNTAVIHFCLRCEGKRSTA